MIDLRVLNGLNALITLLLFVIGGIRARRIPEGVSIRGLVRRETGFFVQACASDKMPTHRKN